MMSPMCSQIGGEGDDLGRAMTFGFIQASRVTSVTNNLIDSCRRRHSYRF